MNKTNLQIPISKELKNKAEKVALKQGFSSLQETVRIFLNRYASGAMQVSFEEPPIQLSAAAIRRYRKIDEDFKKGNNIYHAKDLNDLMKQLNED